MSLIKDIAFSETRFLLWAVGDDEGAVTDADLKSAARFSSPERRRMHLAWRAALRTIMPDAEIYYDENGAPRVDGFCIGVSHTGAPHTTRGLAAVVISPNEPCAVDVERADRNLSHVRPRVLSPEEETLLDASRDDFAVAAWCAKEVLYKLRGGHLRDLKITDSDLAHGTITAADIPMRVLRVGEYIVVGV